MLLLINYHRRLAKSKQTETYFAMIVNAASQEMDFIVKAENLSNDVAGPLARKACLLLSSCLCFFELMKENELLWNMEDSISKSIVNSLLTISKNCNLKLIIKALTMTFRGYL